MKNFRKSLFFRYVASAVLVAFTGFLPATPGYSQVAIIMPPPGEMVHLTSHFEPPQMVGLKINLKNPFSFDFIMDQGQNPMSNTAQKEEFNKLIKYFLVSLTMPNKDMWVNLSPYESQRIIPGVFAQTEMGRDLLEQDYLLKQLTASLMYPEDGLGKKFWDNVYAQAQAAFGTTEINVNNFNKVWIVADRADVYQKDNTAFLVASHLKVMLEQDYMAIEQNKEMFGNVQDMPQTNDAKTQMAQQLVRQIIIPAIEKEVNEGQSFAAVRQVYNAEILATWFKKTLKQSLLGQVFADKSKIAGQRVNDPQVAEKIYDQYLLAYKQGVYDIVRKEVAPDGQVIPRKYFSGGMFPVIQTHEISGESIIDANRRVADLRDRFSAAQQQGPGAVHSMIDHVIGSLPASAPTPSDQSMIDTIANMEPGPQRDLAMATALDYMIRPDASDRTQIPELAQQLSQATDRASLIGMAAQHLDQAQMTLNQPIPQPTMANLLYAMADNSQLSQPSVMAPITDLAMNSGRPQEVRDFALMAENKRNDLFDASARLSPSAATAQAPASQSDLKDLTDTIKDLLGRSGVDVTARTAEELVSVSPNRVTPQDVSRNFRQQVTSGTGAVQSWLQQQLATASPQNLANALISTANLQETPEGQANMMGYMLANLLNPSAPINKQAMQDLEAQMAANYRIQLQTGNALDWVSQKISDTMAKSPSAMTTAFSNMAENQDRYNGSDLIGNIFAGLNNSTMAEDIQEKLSSLKDEERDHYIEQMVKDSTLLQNTAAQIRGSFEGRPYIRPYRDLYIQFPQAEQRRAQMSSFVKQQVETQQLNPDEEKKAVSDMMSGMEQLDYTRRQVEAMAMENLNGARELAQAIVQRSIDQAAKNPGGISLSNEHLALNVKVDGAGMPEPLQFQDQAMLNISGLISVIRKIEPLTPQNVPALYHLLQ